MDNRKILRAEEKLYNSKIKDIDKNLKALIRAQKDAILASRLDDELER
ncbi:MAG: hypothetical protein IJW24_01185 [Clostridia bacterium]|nr:hypothetical protein [Clostridia bacterium]